MRRVALVTGAAKRIGRALATRLATEGFAVVIHYQNSHAEAYELADKINQQGGSAHCLQANLQTDSDVKSIIPSVISFFGVVTCLVNNASIFQDDRIHNLSVDSWDAHFQTNLRAPVLLSQAFAANLPSGMHGNIVNMIDQRVLKPNPQFFSYGLTKSALWNATRTMAQALAPRIRVNAIAPGPVLQSIHQTEQDFADESQSTLLGHGAKPEEIGDALMFILKTSSLTGQMITIDSGQHLLWQTHDIKI